MAQLTKTLMNKRDRALTNAEKALSGYNELVEDIVSDLQAMGEELRASFDKAESAAEKAQDVLDEVFNYAIKKQDTCDEKGDDDEAFAWNAIARSHEVECEVSPEPPEAINEDMDGADMTCLVTEFLDEA